MNRGDVAISYPSTRLLRHCVPRNDREERWLAMTEKVGDKPRPQALTEILRFAQNDGDNP